MNKKTFLKNAIFSMVLFFTITLSAKSDSEVLNDWKSLKELSNFNYDNVSLIRSSEMLPAAPVQVKDTANAVFSNKTSLILDVTSALEGYYKADIINLEFKNSLEGDMFFNKITDNLLSYKVDYTTNTVVIRLHLAFANPTWTVSDWNKYIQSKLNPQN